MAKSKSPISNLQSPIPQDALAILFLILCPFIYFWQVTLGQGVWLTTDILRLFYPFSVELSRALSENRLPLWTPNLLAGFPLLAESQVGALYPINLLLYKFLPTHHALSFNILLHIAWAGCGMYVFTRARGIGVAGAWLAGFVFSFNGVVLGQMFHPPILFAVAWLPWLIFLVARVQTTPLVISSEARNPVDDARDFSRKPLEMTGATRGRAIWFALAALALGIQFLCGSAQIAFLNALAVAVFGVLGGNQSPVNSRQSPVNSQQFIVHRLLFTIFLLALGGGIAAIQLIPTSELIGYSVRGGTLDKEFVTSYSMPPEYLAQFVFPFAPGEPAEGNEEYRAYFGIAPLLLALGALIARRNRQTICFAAFALVALSFALGELNPLYQLLYRLPPFNFFRVPARYLYLFVFAAAFLSAVALDVIASRDAAKQSPTRDVEIACFGYRSAPHPSTPLRMLLAMTRNALALLLFALLAQAQSLTFWLDAWRALPILLALATIGTLALAWTRKIARGTFVIAILGLTMFDLASHAPPFLKTIDALTPTAGVTALPRSVQALGDTMTRGRVWTDDSIFPSPPALRNSLFPNTALLYDKPSAQIYSSLAFGRHQAYVYNMSPAMRDVLSVRFVMLPLEPRPQAKRALPADSLGAIVLRDEIAFDPIDAFALHIVSATEQAADFAQGTPIAEIVIRFDDGASQVLPIRAGIETADWDVARKQLSPRAPIARSFPAYWRAFGRAFDGHAYSARYEFALPRKIVGARVRVLEPDARLLIESIAFETRDKTISLARLIGKNEFALAYLSDTVAAWENRDALPRALIAHTAQVLDDDAAFARLRDSGFDPAREVLLSEGVELRDVAPARDSVEITNYKSERVEIKATTDQPGYLVLADSWYPGWNAFVDGQPAPIYRANVLFRAVRIEPGMHDIVFEYRPLSFALGALISGVSLLIVFGISIWYFRFGKGQ